MSHIYNGTQPALFQKITDHYRADEQQLVQSLLEQIEFNPTEKRNISARAETLVASVRAKRLNEGGIDAFMYQYDLSSEEGLALMCLAEALLRIPDKETVDKLIKDKISSADWAAHIGKSHSSLVNAATLALMFTGKVIDDGPSTYVPQVIKKLIARTSEPVVRQAVAQAMRVMGRQFVMGRNIDEALKRARQFEAKNYRYSYDMLGEAAYTAEDAQKYYLSYETAIHAIGKASNGKGPIKGPGISVKLSALHPRYEVANIDRVMQELLPKVKTLAKLAMHYNMNFTIDAEEADRLELSLKLIEQIVIDNDFADWQGFGFAIQAYQKRASFVIDWLTALLKANHRRMMIRLVKGAYWDSEVKRAQVDGLSTYPVFTRKSNTDVHYLLCAKKMLANLDVIYPQFATHNAHTVSAILEMAKGAKDFEFQCLHGMGEALFDEVVTDSSIGISSRIYAPVGTHEDLLAYLVRRLLENGANSSFVNRIVNQNISISEIVACPIEQVRQLSSYPHPKIPLPNDLYGSYRENSIGLDLSNVNEFKPILDSFAQYAAELIVVKPTHLSQETQRDVRKVLSPINHEHQIGLVELANKADIELAITKATQAFEAWSNTPLSYRKDLLQKLAKRLEQERAPIMARLVFEAGKTLKDAVSEIREAVDFCYYYGEQGVRDLSEPTVLPGPTGETNKLVLKGRGVVACVSPWNFPLAIFLGQVTASLVSGNTVIAKPAMQTNCVAKMAVDLMHEVGFPLDVIQLLPCSGALIGETLMKDDRVKAVIFTGSTETAKQINRTLASREGAIAPFIAETGGQNAMLVDSSALPEQVIADVMLSAFGSAGQRCSALRVLFVQEELAPKIINMLKGAMAELRIADPSFLNTDVGPVIDNASKATLEKHAERMLKEGTLIYQCPLSGGLKGSFFAPRAFEIESLDILKEEVFGPVLHVIRYKAQDLDKVISQINATGFGLTLGVHSRIAETIDYIVSRVKVGNLYVNRNMIGAVVGVQPFGGEGLSGTGPKAGGPQYIHRLCVERTVTVNTTASGGNTTLMSLTE